MRIKDFTTKVGSGVTPRGGAEVYRLEGIPLFRSQNVTNEGLLLDDIAYISKEIHESMSSTRLRANDVLLNITGASIGRCYYLPKDFTEGNVNQHVCIIRPTSKVLSPYLYYCLISNEGQQKIDLTQTGANREGLSKEDICNFEFDIPPLEEQGRIVTYLNDKTGKIDARVSLLTKKRDAYQRLKKALISRVVTKGLNPNAKFKPSGVDWIGEIPEGWKVKRIKDVCGINVLTLNEQMPPNYMFKYIDISSVSNGSIKLSEPITFWEAPSRARRIVSEDDIIVSTVRTYLKAIAHINWKTQDIIASTGFAVITPTKFINPLYLSFYFHHDLLVDDICRNSCGVSFPATTSSFISRLPLLLPPLSEQQSIATYLDEKCSEIDANIANLEKQIEKYKELKRALISEVMTGKRRV